MKRHTNNIKVFLSAILLAGTLFSPLYAQEYGLKKGRNIALSIKTPKRS